MNKKKDKQFYKVKNTNYSKYKMPIQQGWICPKCGAVMAPWMGVCTNCKPITTNTINIIWNKPETDKPIPYTMTATTGDGDITVTHGVQYPPKEVFIGETDE